MEVFGPFEAAPAGDNDGSLGQLDLAPRDLCLDLTDHCLRPGAVRWDGERFGRNVETRLPLDR